MTHECGQCDLCCTLTEVKSLEKPIGVPCPHCRPGSGCAVYDERPAECKSFRCLWLVSSKMGDLLRPDRCGVAFETHWEDGFVLALVDPAKPHAWRQEPAVNLVKRLTQDGHPVLIQSGRAIHTFVPEGMLREEVVGRLLTFERKLHDSASIRH